MPPSAPVNVWRFPAVDVDPAPEDALPGVALEDVSFEDALPALSLLLVLVAALTEGVVAAAALEPAVVCDPVAAY